jgi:hypothetical protein
MLEVPVLKLECITNLLIVTRLKAKVQSMAGVWFGAWEGG